jgi:HEPN domain-containing protein
MPALYKANKVREASLSMSETEDESLSNVEDDYEYAESLFRNGDYHYSCFYAQQVGEKAAKTALQKFGVSRDKGSVSTLIDELKTVAKVPPDILKAAQILDECFVPPTFPGVSNSNAVQQEYTKERADTALKHSRKLIDFLKKITSGR